MNTHPLLWTSPAPLWGRFLANEGEPPTFTALDQQRPAILRFATDEYMEQVLGMLATNPRQLAETIARPETWRSPSDEVSEVIEPARLPLVARTLSRLTKNRLTKTSLAATTDKHVVLENSVIRTLPLKLYQPVHQRHYLVAANLVCGLPGFPDRALASGREQVAFVVRRVLDHDGAPREFAFVKDAKGTRWQLVSSSGRAANPQAQIEEGEELLQLFPLNFRDDTNHPRRILAGSIPVGRREQYMSTRAEHQPASSFVAGNNEGSSQSTGATVISARKEQFRMDVSEPWKNLVRSAHTAARRIKDQDLGAPKTAQKLLDSIINTNDQLQWQSWLLMLDFADYLSTHVPAVWAWVTGEGSPTLSPGAQTLFDWLKGSDTARLALTQISNGSRSTSINSLKDALKEVAKPATRAGLESSVRSFPKGDDWPGFMYSLVGVTYPAMAATGIHISPGSLPPVPPGQEDQIEQVEKEAALLDILAQRVIAAIDTSAPSAKTPPIPFAVEIRDALATTNGDPGWFTLRCAYMRPDCGRLHAEVVSARSQQFQFASFFDSDAPARPIRIALPLDTTPAGLRKFNKNTAFMLSDVLCGQVQRAKGLGFGDLVLSVLPWPFHKDLDIGSDGMKPCGDPNATFGMICSLSIPIITICALILLIMIVLVLELIFHWLPWFIVCFPIPGLKGKK